MDSSYSVYSLTFASGCSSDVLAASGANSLTIGSAVTNASGVLQTIAMPVQLVDLGSPTVASAWNTGSGGITVSDPISDLGTGLTLSGTGPLTLTATNNYTGPTTIASGSTLSLGGSGALGVTATATNYTGNIAIASTGIFNYNSSAAQTLTGIVSGAGQLQQNGPGPLTLNTNDTFSGGLTIAPSTTLTISGTGGINNGAANLISDNGTFVYNSTANQTLTQIISGSGAVTLAGGGQTTTVTLAGRNTYTGITTIENCSLVITNDINLGTAPGSVVANQLTMNCAIVNGTNYLDYGLRFQTTSGAINANRGIYLGANGGSINVQNGVTLTNFEVISGPGAFYASPNASAGYGTILLSALNTYTGPTFIGAGNLNLGLSGALPTGTPLTIGSSFQGAANGSFFNMSGFSQTIGPLASSPGLGATGVGLPTVATGGGALTVFETNISTTFAGVITGAGSLTLTVPPGGTASELILSGTNTYTGATTINAGAELGLTANGAISNSASINIAAGGTFDVSGLTPTPFTLSASTALNASGIGTGSSAAAIKGASAGAVNLASRPINLTYTPAGTSGDATDPALYISQGALTLSGNLITVNNAGSTLGAGVYNLIQVAGGTINGVPSATANVTGAGIAAGATAAISVNGGNVILSVVSATPPTPTITGVSLNGTLLTITATNGAANGPYALLESTNVALPLTNWTVLMSNSFDASGNINFSTNITTNAHEFYIIQQP
jgi:autotransporter-associated beta strand protein